MIPAASVDEAATIVATLDGPDETWRLAMVPDAAYGLVGVARLAVEQAAELRAVEAERDELRRDYGDLIALDTDGLRSRIVELEDAAEQHRLNLESAHAETTQYRTWWSESVAELAAYNAAVDVKAAAEERKRLEAMLDEAYSDNDADRAEFASVVGQPVADRIAEHRHTIRQLTLRLNEALAAMDKAGVR